MSARGAPLRDVLDDAAELAASLFSPWVGLLWLASIPYRLLLARFGARLWELGDHAAEYGDHLTGLALVAGLSLLPALLGRAVFANALHLRLNGIPRPGREAFRLRPSALVAYAYVALLVETIAAATCAGLVTLPLCAAASGLAAVVIPVDRQAGPIRSVVSIGRLLVSWRPLTAMLGIFGVGALLSAVNLLVLFQFGLWLTGGVAGMELTRWEGLLGPANPRFVFVLLAGGWLVVEPFWLATLAVWAQAQRSWATGADLRARLARLRGQLTSSTATTLLVLVTSLVGTVTPGIVNGVAAATRSLSLAEYRSELDHLARALDAADSNEVREIVDGLEAARVDCPQETIEPDPGLLLDARSAGTSQKAHHVATRVRAVVTALGQAEGIDSGETPPPPVRPEALTFADDVPSGGHVRQPEVHPPTLSERVWGGIDSTLDRLAAFRDWVDKVLRALRRAVWPDVERADRDVSTTRAVTVVVVVAFVIGLAFLAVRVFRRGSDLPVTASEGSLSSTRRDEDPLSREADEWTLHAEALARARRWREAIRAWYHAVLVTIFRSGLLHHQRGRTNWEYVARLTPDLPWRAAFVSLTQRFDREWYGQVASSPEALEDCGRLARQIMSRLRTTEGQR